MWSLSLFRDTAVPLLILAPTGTISLANPAALALLGRRSLSGVELATLVAAEDRTRLAEYLLSSRALRPGQGATLDSVELQCAGGPRFARLVGSAGLGERGVPVLFVSPQVGPEQAGAAGPGQGQDVLTRVASRSRGLEVLAQEVHPRANGCLLLVDIDEFDDFNLVHGVALGDRVLVEIASRLRGAVPLGATVARLDGDLFLVVAPTTSVARVTELGRLLLSAVAAPMDVAGTRVVTSSIGVAALAASGADEALTRAGQALATAKAQGGRQLVLEGPTSFSYGRRRSDLMATVRAMESSLQTLRSDAERAHTEARTDPLTGLPNERRYEEDLGLLQDRARRAGARAAALFIDLDEFGLVNKTFGQERGDRTLTTVAAVLAAQCRAGDAVYRVGGEEFVVLLPDCDLRGGCLVAERLRLAVEAAAIPHNGRPGTPILTISVGVASGSGASLDTARVVHVANREMRRAKSAGRNGVFPQLDPPVGAA